MGESGAKQWNERFGILVEPVPATFREILSQASLRVSEKGMNNNQKAIQVCSEHGCNAYENEQGILTMVIEFFGAQHVELVECHNWTQVARNLGY